MSMENMVATKPRLGFAGVGWIGKSRLKAIRRSNTTTIAGASDVNQALLQQLAQEMPDVQSFSSFEALLESDVEGIVIATPSALHAEQSLAALQKGKAVFCQKPLGRHAEEAAAVVEAARTHNLLLGVDFSYRHTQAVQQIRQLLASGTLGEIYGISLTFHNAYGPDKPWYHDPALSGGGCLMDLGIHLIDLLFWLFEKPEVSEVRSHLFRKGKRLQGQGHTVEDYAVGQFLLNNRTAVQLSCSWFLPAGRDAVIEACFYGERGGLAFRNVNGSFYDFVAEHYQGTATETLVAPPDDWGGRAAVRWANALSRGAQFDPEAYTYVEAARVLDALYQQRL